MSAPIDIMAWMQKAYIDGQHIPWYKKIYLRIKLLIERKVKRVKGTPGAKAIDALLEETKAKGNRIDGQQEQATMSRRDLAKMWDNL